MRVINNLSAINLSLSAIYILVLSFIFTELPLVFNTLLVSLCIWNLVITLLNRNKPNALLANTLAGFSLLVLFYDVGFGDTVTLFVAMLILSSLFKLLQATTKKHYQTITLLSFFSLSTVYLFSQSLFATLIISILYILNFAVLALIESTHNLKIAVKGSLKLLLLALPISIFLLLLLPKVPAFWQLPGPKLAKTGLSESVDPFDIAKLSNSDELVFRAKFNEQRPAGPYYWRAIIHDEFDGKTWLISDILKTKQAIEQTSTNFTDDPLYSYQIFAEPAAKPWLYGLQLASSTHKDVKTTSDGLLVRKRFLANSVSYTAQSYPLAVTQLPRTAQYQNVQLNLAKDTNMQSQSFAKRLFEQHNNDDDAFYTALYDYFANNGFSYTLTPDPITGSNTLDQFLFNNKRGFCGHYASTAAFMFRSVGIPARVVSGYLGGEYNQQNSYLSVYQYDAHAWVEVYIKSKGWQIFDATAVVSPERLNGSLSQHAQLNNEFTSNLGFGLLRLSNIAGFNWLRLKLENLDYQWTSWVLGFDQQKQASLLNKLFGNKQLWQISLIVIATVCLAFICYFVYLSWPKKSPEPTHALAKDYLKIVSWCDKQGIVARPNQTPLQFLDYAAEQQPEKRIYIEQFAQLYSDVRYRQLVFSSYRKKHSKDLIKLIKTKMKRKL
ncbi:transglutaminase TgpA family protein [Pseudoalteromonas sp. ASV78]|uniref:transglutaminase TgpA family protein n=1 Tax=Pseudoalteromonas sp. ASV78 TaxID=3397851 RepID=UPI0039FC689A